MRRPARASRLSLFVALIFVLSAFPGQVGAAPGGNASATFDRFVTGPSAGSAARIALDHIRSHARALGLRASDTDDIAVTDRYTDSHTGVTHVYLRQRYRGIEVVDANANYNIARNGSIISFSHSFVRDLGTQVRGGSDRLSAAAAVKSAARQLGLKAPASLRVLKAIGGADAEVIFGKNGISLEAITAKLVYQRSGSVLRLSWQIELYEPSGAHWWNLRADASTGKILARTDYGNHADDAYNVFALPKESPNDGARTLEVNPATGASPLAWHDVNGGAPDFTRTQGNNVLAYTDRNADNLPDSGAAGLGFAEGGASRVFDFPFDPTLAPVDYQPAAVTNLFYWNNIIHDVLYNYGFNEKSGNFQVNNFAPSQGKGGDPVRAEAQDGSGRNNANFFTPPDGFAPRMQMFEWRDPEPNPLTVEGVGTFFGPMAGFGQSLTTTGPISGQLVVANDGTAPNSDGCQAFPAGSLEGKIPLIDRGTCTFVVKVKNAQNAGADAAVVANNVAGAPFGMGGADTTITIPSIMISLADATAIKPELPAAATLSPSPDLLPDRDSDFDNGVIVHEYGHGVSNRLTGGPGTTGCLQNAEQMGEGWSDLLALMLTAQAGDSGTDARGIGTYVVFEASTGAGIRPTPYSTSLAVNDSTYQDVIDTNGVTLSIPHGVGYVWATMVWEVYWNLVEEHGFNADIYDSWDSGGNNLTLQLMIDGMKFQRCSPGFVDGRNAILEADLALTGGDNQCLIWEGFAKRGLGFSAEQRSSKKTGDGTAAFDLPPECQAGGGVIVPVGMPATLGQTSGHLRSARRRRLAGARRSR